MAYTFPLALADFFEGLRLTSLAFELGENMEVSETGGGEFLSNATGPRLWHGAVHIATDTVREMDQVIAKIDLLRQPGRSFFIGDPYHAHGADDPAGSVLGDASVVFDKVHGNNRELKLKGAPHGYEVVAGDHISIAHGTSPRVYDYFRVVKGRKFLSSQSSTVTGWIEVQPFIPTGISKGTEVRLVKPQLEAVYMPDTFSGGMRKPGGLAQGVSFRWQQTLR